MTQSLNKEFCEERQEEIRKNGFTFVEGLCDPELTKSLLKVTQEKLDEKLRSLEGKEIGIGSAAGYKEICQRSKGRWDVPLDLNDFGIKYNECPWWPIIAATLGEDALCGFQGIISSAPDSPDQEWHIDSPHTSQEHSPANMINVLIALEDIDMEMGPTQIAAGSHTFTNHFQNPKIETNKLVYQCSETSPESLLACQAEDRGVSGFDLWTAPLKAGTVILFDDRVLHRGQANRSSKFRHVAYFSYRRKDYEQNTYFETNRSLADNP